MGHGGDVIDELTTGHREVAEFFAQIDRAEPGASTSVRSSATANKLLAPGLGLVDRARDFVTGRGK